MIVSGFGGSLGMSADRTGDTIPRLLSYNLHVTDVIRMFKTVFLHEQHYKPNRFGVQ